MFVKRNKTDNFQLPLHVFCHFLMGKYHTVQGTVYSVQLHTYDLFSAIQYRRKKKVWKKNRACTVSTMEE